MANYTAPDSFPTESYSNPETERTAEQMGINLNKSEFQSTLEVLRKPELLARRGDVEPIDRMGGSEGVIFCQNTHGSNSELISWNDRQRIITCTGRPIGWNFGVQGRQSGGSISGSSHSESHVYNLDNVCKYFHNRRLTGRARLFQKVFGTFEHPNYSRTFYRDGECMGVSKY